jgi:mono/diheme cytochrome c family protein
MKKILVICATLALTLAMAAPAFADDAAATYKAKCQVCHGPDGKGSAAGQKMGAKPFSELKSSEAEQIKATKEGKNKMPKFEGKLTDDEIKALIPFTKTLK